MPLIVLPLQQRSLVALGRLVADEHGEPALVITASHPRRESQTGGPYVVLQSQANEWEKAHAAHLVDPVTGGGPHAD